MNKPKILFILHTPPPVHGSSMVGQYIKKSEIINKSFNCYYINFSTSRTIDEIGNNPIIKITRYLGIIFRVVKKIITNKPQYGYMAITAKGIGFYKDALVALIIKSFGIRMLYHFHNKGVQTKQNKTFDNFLYRLVFKSSNAILLSEYLYPDVQKYFTKDQVHVCPNGILDVDIQFSDNEIYNQYEKTPKILFLSNLIESKGIFILLKALQLLRDKGLNFKCNFIGGIGDISLQRFNNAVSDFGLEKQVIYLGKKYGKEKEHAFQQADIFVHPSYEDCVPLVILEAMQHTLPVISTLEGGIPDMVEEGKSGFLVQSKDSVALAQKLEILINDRKLRKQMGLIGRNRYINHFTLEHFENRFTRILKDITNTLT